MGQKRLRCDRYHSRKRAAVSGMGHERQERDPAILDCERELRLRQGLVEAGIDGSEVQPAILQGDERDYGGSMRTLVRGDVYEHIRTGTRAIVVKLHKGRVKIVCSKGDK